MITVSLRDLSRADIYQELHHLAPDITIMAMADGVVQRRSTGMRVSQQGGWEVVARSNIETSCRGSVKAFALLTAPNCPSGTCICCSTPAR